MHARNLRQRYALAFHTDEPHPHVHVVVKAMTEDWVHLTIRKGMLRQWRKALRPSSACTGRRSESDVAVRAPQNDRLTSQCQNGSDHGGRQAPHSFTRVAAVQRRIAGQDSNLPRRGFGVPWIFNQPRIVVRRTYADCSPMSSRYFAN